MIIYGVRWRVVFVGSALIELVRYSSLQPNPLRMEEVPWWWHAWNQLIWDACYAPVSPNRSNLSSCISDEPGEHAGVGNEGFPGWAVGVTTGPGGLLKECSAQLLIDSIQEARPQPRCWNWKFPWGATSHSMSCQPWEFLERFLSTRRLLRHGYHGSTKKHHESCKTPVRQNHAWGCNENVNRQDQIRSHV